MARESTTSTVRFGSYDVRVVSESSTTEPVTLSEAQSWLKIAEGDTTASSVRVTSLIKTARRRAERYLNKDIIGKDRIVFWTFLDNEDVHFPYTAETITSVEVDGLALDSTQYETLGLDNPVLRIFTGQSEKVEVAYSTASISDEEEVKTGILMLVEEMFHEVRTPWKAVLSPFKVYGYYGQR